MKKIIIVLFIFTLIVFSKTDAESISIPEDSIRFRIIANSDSVEDQTKKIAIKEQIEQEVFPSFNKVNNIFDFRQQLKRKIPKIQEILDQSQISYDLNYGNNYFPPKEYKGVAYTAGNYESLVITLGEGAGHNWWCVLFPPLCLIESEENKYNEVEYKSYIQEILSNYL